MSLSVSSALSWIFTPQCAACGDEVGPAPPFCRACAGSLVENLVCCPSCAEALPGSRSVVCRRCRVRPLPLHRIIAPWQYGGALADAIVRLKFGRHTEIARALAPLIAPVVIATALVSDATMIVPVPLHWTRRLRRGFDQTRLLLRHACAMMAPPCAVRPALRRVRVTDYQSRTSGFGRYRNVAAAIAVAPRWRLELVGARILLFDDVVTTGATMAAAARVLLRAGAARVIGVALARGGHV